MLRGGSVECLGLCYCVSAVSDEGNFVGDMLSGGTIRGSGVYIIVFVQQVMKVILVEIC